MRSSRTITLFSERPDLTQRPSAFVFSILVHAATVALVFIGILYAPGIDNRIVPRRFTVRRLDLHTPEADTMQSAAKGMAYPGPHLSARKPETGRRPGARQAVLRQTANAEKGLQTLIQPDIPDPVKIPLEMPVPSVVIWSPMNKPVKTIVAPLPEKATASDVTPSVNAPNQEIDLADLEISSTDTPTANRAIFPGTSSPLVVHGPNPVQKAPVTTSQTSAPPTPAAVMSISNLRMPDGTAILPPVNQTTEQNESGILAPGQASTGNRANSVGGSGNAAASDDSGQPKGITGIRNGASAGAGSGSDNGPSTVQFSLPKNGQFGAVVVGANLEEKFPEMSGIWNDRVAYTVYLHVGLDKSWILQYSLPRSNDAEQAGNITRLDAPWPYNIVRPNISPDAFNSDAVLIHGFVNRAGRFESLAIAFPPQFQQAQFVLDALNQWQFRPAAQNGQIEKVEVLLIIPEERE